MTPESMPTDATARIVSVQAGRVAPLGPQGVPSGFVKHVVNGPVHAGKLGLEGDEPADLTVHGGPDKAIYGYALASYSVWLRDFPRHGALLTPGGLGENLTIEQLDETTVCIGDIVRVGTAALQVSQPRQPCFKFALRFNDKHLPRAMMRNGLCGWYYRVLEPGMLGAGDTMTLQARPNPNWSIARFHRLIAGLPAAPGDMAELTKLEGLAAHWREAARQAVSGP
jgi:MOSC domain-containing protein YiiM